MTKLQPWDGAKVARRASIPSGESCGGVCETTEERAAHAGAPHPAPGAGEARAGSPFIAKDFLPAGGWSRETLFRGPKKSTAPTGPAPYEPPEHPHEVWKMACSAELDLEIETYL